MKFGDFVKKFVEDPDRDNLTIEDYDQEINTAHSKSKNIVITDEFKNIIDGLLNSKKIFHFVSGVAGTGKSTLINEIRK